MKVYYEKDESINYLLDNRLKRTVEALHFYIPDYGLEVYGKTPLWNAKELTEIPEKAVELEASKQDIEELMNVYQKWQSELEGFKEEIEQVMPKIKVGEEFSTKNNPVKYRERFSNSMDKLVDKILK